MREGQSMTISVTINDFQDRILLAKKTKKTGKPKYWTVNGQSLYNASLHFRVRSKVTKHFHNYLSKHIKKQITKAMITELNNYIRQHPEERLSVSLDIYEVKRGKMPDIGNMWIWIKWFEDALQECGIIENDNPDFVIESGRKKYHWVQTPEERKLLFKIEFINQ